MGLEFVEALAKAKTLRESADYYGDFTKAGAKDLIKKAEEFLEKTREIFE